MAGLSNLIQRLAAKWRWYRFLRQCGPALKCRPQQGTVGRRVVIHGALAQAAIELGEGVTIADDVQFELGPGGELIIGRDAWLSRGITISAHRHVSIGHSSLVGEYSSIRDSNHGIAVDGGVPIRFQPLTCAPIQIGHDVWLGRGVAVLAGATVGDGAVVGANAVVTKAVPNHAIAVGIPARVIKGRS